MHIRYLSLLFLIVLSGCKSAEEKRRIREERAAEKAAQKEAAREEKRAAKEAEQAERDIEADAQLQASLAADSPFRPLHYKMSEGEVENLLGAPTSKDSQHTGREFVPFNIGGRGAVETTWFYKGKGRVVFIGAFGGVNNRLFKAIDDPTEVGYKVTQRPEAK